MDIREYDPTLELKDSSNLVDSIFLNANEAVIVINSDAEIISWNPKAETIFNYSRKEALGKSISTLILSSDHHIKFSNLFHKYESLIKNNSKIETEPVSFVAINKSKIEINITLLLCPALIQEDQLYVCYINDITNQKFINAELDKQKEFYENILNKLPTDIAVFDANHKYLFVNPGAIGVEEYRKFIIGKDDYEYAKYRNRHISTADARRAQFLQVKKTGKEIRWEDSLPDANGNVITHLRRMFPVHDENGELTLVIGFGIDITDRKLMEVKQAKLVEQLSAQNIQLTDFCNIVSHNLRAPLVNMSMLVELIEKNHEPDRQQLYISKLRPVIDNLHSTFNELVESIQVKQDIEIKSEKIDLNKCLENTLQGMETEIGRCNAIFNVDFSEADHILFPSKYIYSIFHNLISNTLKYQSPDRNLVVKLKTRKEHDKIILSVEDNGLGINLEKHRESFFKIGKVFHRHPDAKGFGLYMTKTQVDAMNGKIWVESTPDVGSTFFIEFVNQKS